VAKQNQITDQTLMTSPVDQQLNNVTIDNPAHLEADADDADPANSPASQTLFWLAVAGLTVSIMTLGYLAYRKQEQPFQ